MAEVDSDSDSDYVFLDSDEDEIIMDQKYCDIMNISWFDKKDSFKSVTKTTTSTSKKYDKDKYTLTFEDLNNIEHIKKISSIIQKYKFIIDT